MNFAHAQSSHCLSYLVCYGPALERANIVTLQAKAVQRELSFSLSRHIMSISSVLAGDHDDGHDDDDMIIIIIIIITMRNS